MHQRDERGYDDAGAFEHRRGELIAERLARAGRHDREGAGSGEDAVDDVALDAAEGGEAEDAGEGFERIGGHCGGVRAISPGIE